MKFTKSKVNSLLGKVETHFALQVAADDPRFVVIASAGGVRFEGSSPDFWGQDGAELLARTIGQAFTEYQQLRPKFATNLSGH